MLSSERLLSTSRIVVGAFLVCLFCYGIASISTRGKHWTLDRNIDSLIQTELPNGTRKSQVEKWLVAKGVTAFAYESGEQLLYNSVIEDSKHKPSELSGVVRARLDTGGFFLNHNSTHIAFFFDKKGGLIDRSTERGAIGL